MMDEQLKALCEEARGYADRIEGMSEASPELRTVLTRGSREIRRSLARFDSKLLLGEKREIHAHQLLVTPQPVRHQIGTGNDAPAHDYLGER